MFKKLNIRSLNGYVMGVYYNKGMANRILIQYLPYRYIAHRAPDTLPLKRITELCL